MFHSTAALEAGSRQGATSAYCGNAVALCRCLGKLKLFVDPNDVSLAPHLMLDGYWESWVTLAVMRHVKPDMVCVDVGANVGYFSMLMAHLGARKVLAVEPQADLARLIVKSASVNGFSERVTVFSGAASDHRGPLLLLPAPGNNRGSTQVVRELEPLVRHDMISGERLDVLLPSETVHFVKMDCEGYEPEVWDGMAKVLERCSPVICMEFASVFYADGGDALLARIRGAGYAVALVGLDGSIVPSPTDEQLKVGHHMLWLTRASV